MAESPRISDAEWLVMEIIWNEHPLTARRVADALAGPTGWSERTVKTLLNRLVRKGALAYEPEGKRYWYRPQVTRESCVRAQSDSFMDRVFGGSASPLLAHFLKESSLSPDEISELRRLLEEKERG